jgi:GNAT superfamily N-acetyltransferase/RimJ/RimL family protein N-acetyltransferase
VRIEQFDPRTDEARLRACHQMVVSGQPDDDPNAPPMSFGNFRGWWTYGFAGEPQQTWLATTDSGDPAGCYLLEMWERENRTTGFFYPVVERSSRRRGIGTALVAHAADQAELADRTLLMSNARVGAPGSAFAEAIGARSGMQDTRRVLDVDPGLHSRLRRLRAAAEPRAAGYTLRRWTGPTPDELVIQACTLSMAMEDAPHDDAFEPPHWDPARLRVAEERLIAQGTRWYSVAAIVPDTGEMAALTEVHIDPEIIGWAFQEITAVIRPHRGHRLGLLTKVAMLEWLAELEPQVRQIMTYNAGANEHMIAVNDQLGHRVTDYFQSFELEVTAAGKLAARVGSR